MIVPRASCLFDYYGELIVLDYNELTAHGKTNAVLTPLRQMFWIPRGRSFVRKVIVTVFCAYEYPVPPDLPEFCVSDELSELIHKGSFVRYTVMLRLNAPFF